MASRPQSETETLLETLVESLLETLLESLLVCKLALHRQHRTLGSRDETLLETRTTLLESRR